MSHGEIRSKEKRQFRKRISETRFFSSLVVAFEISRNSSAPPLRTGCTNFREPFPFAPRRVGKAAVQEFNIKLYIPRNFTGVVNNFNSNGGLRVRNKKYKKRRKTVTLHVCMYKIILRDEIIYEEYEITGFDFMKRWREKKKEKNIEKY